VSFGTLALICLCGLAGPLLSAAGRGGIPVVIGEILAGVIIGRTGFDAFDTTNTTLSFLSNIGFAMLMLSAGMNVPLRDRQIHASLRTGGAMAAIVAVLAVAGGVLVSGIGGAGHPAIYAVLLASGSAAVVLPIVQERGLAGPAVLSVMAQVTVADVAATLALPIVLEPHRAGRAFLGAVLVTACVLAVFAVAHRLQGRPEVHEFRHMGKRRHWAIDLRLALIVLFALAWIAQRSGTSLLVAGFAAGLMVAAIGGPKRLSTEVLGIAGGFFVPLFFVVLGARLDLSGLVNDPATFGLAGALVALNVAIHSVAALLTRQSPAGGLLATAQLGIPSAVIALGLPAHVITQNQAGAILAAAVLSLPVCAVGAAWIRATRTAPGQAPGALPPAHGDPPADPAGGQ
jgi:Kef-type K+ transport system membrane component KefB